MHCVCHTLCGTNGIQWAIEQYERGTAYEKEGIAP